MSHSISEQASGEMSNGRIRRLKSRTRRRVFGLTVVVVAAILALAACTAAAPATPAVPAAKQPAAPAAKKPAAPAAKKAPAKAAPEPSGVLSLGLPLFPPSLDPQVTSAPPGYVTLLPIFDALISVDDKAQLQPALATNWKNIDPTTWEFKLREDVKFSNGDAFDSESVKFTLERAMNPENRLRLTGRLGSFASVEATDTHTVRIITKGPNPTVPQIMTMVLMMPTDFGGMDPVEFTLKPIGTGAFTVEEFAPGSKVTYAAAEDSWRGQPKLAGLELNFIPEDGPRLAAMRSGDIDAMQRVPVDEVASMGQDYRIESIVAGSVVQGLLRTDTGPLADKRVRQALNYAVNKQEMIDTILGGYGVLADGQIAGNDAFGYNPDVSAYPYDPDKAKALLKEAGVEDGLKIEIQAIDNPSYPLTVVEAVGGALGDVGIDVTVTRLEPAVAGKVFRFGPRPPIYFAALDYGPSYDAAFVYTWSNSRVLPDTGHWSDPRFDAAWDASMAEFDPAKRVVHLQEMGRILREEAGALILWQPVLIYAIAKNVDWDPGPGLILWFDDASKS